MKRMKSKFNCAEFHQVNFGIKTKDNILIFISFKFRDILFTFLIGSKKARKLGNKRVLQISKSVEKSQNSFFKKINSIN